MGWASFPRVPRTLVDWPAQLELRRYGARASDLDVDLDQPIRALACAEVVAACASPALAAAQVAGVPVSVRVRAALRLAALETPDSEQVLRCHSCNDELAVSLPLATLASDDGEPVAAVEVDGVRVRVPTGADQASWARRGGFSPALLGELVESGEPPSQPAFLAAVESGLADVDPLVEFAVRTACPACGAGVSAPVDLEAVALAPLRRVKRDLIADVHRLASVYHWSEEAILALPAHRRAAYLELVGGDA